MTGNTYDSHDIVRREAVLIADGSSSLKVAAYRVRDPETKEFGPLQFHMTYDNTVLAFMGQESAKVFAGFVVKTLGDIDPHGHKAAAEENLRKLSKGGAN